MYCKICGATLAPGEVLCKNCGASNTNLEPKAPTVEPMTGPNPIPPMTSVEPTPVPPMPPFEPVQPETPVVPEPPANVEVAGPSELPEVQEPVQNPEPTDIKKEKEPFEKKENGKFLVVIGVIVGILSALVIGYLIYGTLTAKKEGNSGVDVVTVNKNYSVIYANYEFELTTEYTTSVGKYLEISKSTWNAKIAYSAEPEFARITSDNLKKVFETITDYKIGNVVAKTYNNVSCFETQIDYTDGVKSLLLLSKRDVGGYWIIEIGVNPYTNYPTSDIANEVVSLIAKAKKEEAKEAKLRIEDVKVVVEENTETSENNE